MKQTGKAVFQMTVVYVLRICRDMQVADYGKGKQLFFLYRKRLCPDFHSVTAGGFAELRSFRIVKYGKEQKRFGSLRNKQRRGKPIPDFFRSRTVQLRNFRIIGKPLARPASPI